jgi:hypothetical protein
MARDLPKQAAQLTPQEMKAGIGRLRKRLEDLQRFDFQSVIDRLDTARGYGSIGDIHSGGYAAPELDALGACPHIRRRYVGLREV